MASSSVSQESIDIEDYDLCTRRSRIRMMRGRTTAGSHKTEYHESMESGDHKYVKVRICTYVAVIMYLFLLYDGQSLAIDVNCLSLTIS